MHRKKLKAQENLRAREKIKARGDEGTGKGTGHGMLRKGILKIAPGTRNFKDSTGARDFHPLLRGGVLLLI